MNKTHRKITQLLADNKPFYTLTALLQMEQPTINCRRDVIPGVKKNSDLNPTIVTFSI